MVFVDSVCSPVVRSEKFHNYIMDSGSLVHSKDHKGKPSLRAEVANLEKKLWTWIHTKGPLHSDVQGLYRIICACYEQIILNDHEVAGLQDVEYSLWKLHYSHIDEYRERINKSSSNEETTRSSAPQNDIPVQKGDCNYVNGFKLFLSEATEFYQHLISKTKKHYGLPEAFSFNRTSDNFASTIEPKNMQILHLLCHRFLVCLGDLARYKEQFDNVQNHNWSTAVAYYIEATCVWPDSGNPQNQLAVLATYVGDGFLALYHCIRSLAVKEPFPDAWKNLILLFERNWSSYLPSFSMDAYFDFLKPFERSQQTTGMSDCRTVKTDHESSCKSELWLLIIRTLGFFFLASSLEDFSCTFASMMKELDVLMTLDDMKLKGALESYQHMDSARSGPFRILQVVCIFIFVIEKQIYSRETEDVTRSHEQQLVLTKLALTTAFIFMGRLADRCLNASLLDSCPLLPALLVFVEWLVDILEKAEEYASDDKVISAMSYFFGALVELLNSINTNGAKIEASPNVALWEDFELQGFASISHLHASRVYSTIQGCADSFEIGTEWRLDRMVNAAMQIVDRSSDNKKWFSYDKSRGKFCAVESIKVPNGKDSEKVGFISTISEVEESHRHIHKVMEQREDLILSAKTRDTAKSVAMDEEEVILFKPLTRYNSAPISSFITSNQKLPKDAEDHILPADECLRRATSLLIAQNHAQFDPSAFHSALINFGHDKQLKQHEPLMGGKAAYSQLETSISEGSPPFSSSIAAGPPSLNAWVLNEEILGNDIAKGKNQASRHSLSPIEEVVSASLSDLFINELAPAISINQSGPPICSFPEPLTNSYSSPNCSAPVPSAPFLPENVVWFNGTESTLSGFNSFGNISSTNTLYCAPQVNGYSNWTGPRPTDYVPGIPTFIDGYQPVRQLNSSEWLKQYRENNKWPSPPYTALKASYFLGHEMSGPSLFDQGGAPIASNSLIYADSPVLHTGVPPVYSIDGHRREMFYTGIQRPSPYGCGALNEPELLRQSLKDKEWLLQHDPTFRGPTYMGT